jgi:hypothetical protein
MKNERLFCFVEHKAYTTYIAGLTAFEEAPWRPGTSA